MRFLKWLERCSLQSKTGAYDRGFERVTAASGVESARLNDWFVGPIPIVRSMILLMQLAFRLPLSQEFTQDPVISERGFERLWRSCHNK
jgi:hypothetical protein